MTNEMLNALQEFNSAVSKLVIGVSSFIGTELTAEVLHACNKLDDAIQNEPIERKN